MLSFDKIEDAAAYMMSSAFRYPDEVSSFQGKDVLKLFKLNPSESERYRRISKAYGWDSWKEVGTSQLKSYGADAAGTLYHASRGNLFGMIRSYAAMMMNMGKSDDGIDERLAERNPENGVFRQLEKSLQYRQLDVYPYVKSRFPDRKPRVASRRVGFEDGCAVFMFGI